MNEMEARLKALELAFSNASDGMPWENYIEIAEKLSLFIIGDKVSEDV